MVINGVAMDLVMKRVLKENMWQKRFIGKMGTVQEFRRFEEFVTTAPLEGLGADMALVKRICRDDKETLDLIDQATQGQHGGDHGNQYTGGKIDNVTLATTTGNGEQYALRRLRKDRPDLHAKVLGNELSAHAAMVEAGFRERMLTIPPDPERAARIILKHFDQQQVMRLVNLLRDAIEN
jgi:hypothetical protein